MIWYELAKTDLVSLSQKHKYLVPWAAIGKGLLLQSMRQMTERRMRGRGPGESYLALESQRA